MLSLFSFYEICTEIVDISSTSKEDTQI